MLFTSPRGQLLRHSNFWRTTWAPALAANGLSGIHFHDLRHAGNHLVAEAGAGGPGWPDPGDDRPTLPPRPGRGRSLHHGDPLRRRQDPPARRLEATRPYLVDAKIVAPTGGRRACPESAWQPPGPGQRGQGGHMSMRRQHRSRGSHLSMIGTSRPSTHGRPLMQPLAAACRKLIGSVWLSRDR